MPEPVSAITALTTILTFFKNLKDLFPTAKVASMARRYLSTSPKELDRLVVDYFSQNTGYGEVVTTTGLLSKYVLNRPQAFAYQGFKLINTEIQSVNQTQTIDENLEVIEVEKKSKMLPFSPQLPVQVIPPIIKENQKTFVYFLYDPYLTSFHMDVSPEEPSEIRKNGRIMIDNRYKPVVVLSDKELIKETECTVKIKGTLKEFDDATKERFFVALHPTQQEIWWNSIRPHSNTATSLCIDLRTQDAAIDITEKKTILPGTIYLESHFENMENIPSLGGLYGDALPNDYPSPIHWVATDQEVSYGIANTDVIVVNKNFSNFTFSLDTDLANQDIYEPKLRYLSEFINSYRNSVIKLAKDRSNVDSRMEIDLLFNSRHSTIFEPLHILNSNASRQISAEENEWNEVMNWLRNNRPPS